MYNSFMINWLMKKIGETALKTDLAKIDPSRVPEDISEINDIPYEDDGLSGHTLDVYIRRDGTRKPILIDIHGGGFISEDKAMNRLFGCYMASLGFTVFALNVRLAYPEFNVFDQVEDIGRAVRFVQKIAEDHEADPEQLYISGHSSGCVLALAEALLCVDPAMRKDYGSGDRDYGYKGIITDCGLLHFYKRSIAYWGMRKMVFPKGYKDDKRYKYLVFEKNNSIRNLPRLALLTNPKDVLRKMTFHFDGILTDFGTEHKLMLYGRDGHTGIIFVPYKDENIEVLKQAAGYLSEN